MEVGAVTVPSQFRVKGIICANDALPWAVIVFATIDNENITFD
jgi:hypothetical protein